LSITGLSTATFKAASDNISKLYALFSRSVAQSKLQSCTTVSSFQNHASMELYNRYFTPRKNGLHGVEKSFSPDIDPTGVLTKLIGTSFYHGEENEVAYFEKTIGDSGDNR
jgi:hypothetical protein